MLEGWNERETGETEEKGRVASSETLLENPKQSHSDTRGR